MIVALMKEPSGQFTHTHGLSRRSALKALSLASVAALTGLRSARADDPPPDDATSLPPAKPLLAVYQPSHYSTDPTIFAPGYLCAYNGRANLAGGRAHSRRRVSRRQLL